MIALLKISRGYSEWLLLRDLPLTHVSELTMRSFASATFNPCENHGAPIGIQIHRMIEVFPFLRLCMQSLGKENLFWQCICLFVFL